MQDAPKASPIARKWADKLDISPKYIFKLVKKHGYYTSGKKRKANAGQIPSHLIDHIYTLAAIYHKLQANRKPGVKGKMPLEVAREMFEYRFQDIQLPTSSTIYSYLRKLNISRKDIQTPAPKMSMKTLHPNHVWAYDTGVCDYYLEADDTIMYINQADHYKNKPNKLDKKRRLVRHLIVDLYSGAFFIYYTETQTRLDYADFLYMAFAPKQDPRYILHGVPKAMLMDNDVGLRSYPIMRMLSYLDVKVPHIEPYRPWVKGAVEELMKTWARWFETRFLYQKTADIDTINQWAFDYAVKFQKERTHTRHRMTRFECWDSYITGHLKEIGDHTSFQRLVHLDPVTRQVNSEGYFPYKKGKYKAPGLYTTTVDVVEHMHLYAENKGLTVFWPSETENKDNFIDFEVQQFTVLPEAIDLAGYEDSNIILMEQGGYIEPTQRMKNIEKVKAVDVDNMGLKPMDIKDKSGIEFIPKTGTPINTASDFKFEEKLYTLTQLKLEIANKLRRPLKRAELDHIKTLPGEKFSKDDINTLFNYLIEMQNNKKNIKGA
jgi:hypothetical protein